MSSENTRIKSAFERLTPLGATDEVIALDYTAELLLLGNGEEVPIIVWLDEYGDLVDKDDADYCVAGPDLTGQWHREKLSSFGKATRH